MVRPFDAVKLEKKRKEYLKRFPSVKKLIIYPSHRADKRFTAEFTLDNHPKKIHFGMKTATTFFDDSSLWEKRRLYQKRASKITNKFGEYTNEIPGTANSFSYYILW